MYVVLRGITIWTLYALLSCVSIATCLSASDRVRWELVFDPMPDETYERYVSQYVSKRITAAAVAASNNPPRNSIAAAKRLDGGGGGGGGGGIRVASARATPCNCTQIENVIKLPDSYFPNVLYSNLCQGNHWCKNVEYPVWVLKNNVIDIEDVKWNKTKNGLPRQLEANWWFIQVYVTAGCSCPTVVKQH